MKETRGALSNKGVKKNLNSAQSARIIPPGRATVPLVRQEATIVSPLRYPGGKRRLAAFIAETLRLNDLRPKLFVEPFAGGASVALQLLNDGLVEAIALGERDPLVASFWKIVFNDHKWLLRRIKQIKPTLRGWDYYKNGDFKDDYSRALACLYLNRTSFSGILAPGAGPIGGRSQESDYKIDCRFNAIGLSRRISQAAALRDKVLFVNEGGWKQTISLAKRRQYKQKEIFFYFDPPFYEKARQLYRYYFAERDHIGLRDYLTGLPQPWLLSYDPAPSIRELYSDHADGSKHVRLLYSASRAGEVQESQELIVTNLHSVPEADRLWRSAQEWRI